MFKRTRDGKPKRSSIVAGEPTPQFLSEELIAELQGAVIAAQRKRARASHDEVEKCIPARESLRTRD
jgi:hypothetical protein